MCVSVCLSLSLPPSFSFSTRSSLHSSPPPPPHQRAGLRRRHATASWTYLFRLIVLLSSSSSSGPPPRHATPSPSPSPSRPKPPHTHTLPSLSLSLSKFSQIEHESVRQSTWRQNLCHISTPVILFPPSPPPSPAASTGCVNARVSSNILTHHGAKKVSAERLLVGVCIGRGDWSLVCVLYFAMHTRCCVLCLEHQIWLPLPEFCETLNSHWGPPERKGVLGEDRRPGCRLQLYAISSMRPTSWTQVVFRWMCRLHLLQSFLHVAAARDSKHANTRLV